MRVDLVASSPRSSFPVPQPVPRHGRLSQEAEKLEETPEVRLYFLAKTVHPIHHLAPQRAQRQTTQNRKRHMATAVDLSTKAGQLYTSGLAVEAIAKELSVTYRTARKAVQLSGVELRDPSERLKGRTRKSPLA